MREKLLESIICKCISNSFTIKPIFTDVDEIREGEVVCNECGHTYKIFSGILDFIHTPTDQIVDEQKANLEELREYKSGLSDGWILNLPFSQNFAHTRDYLFIGNILSQDVDSLIQMLKLSKEKKVLDLGAGTCWTTNRLAATGAYCVALDISAEKFIGLESADVFIKHYKNYFERIRCGMENLPFKNESFDVVFAAASIHHSANVKKVLSESFRILKPDGLFVAASEPCKSIFDKSEKIDIKKAREEGYVVVEGANENIYDILEYVEILKNSKLKPKLYPSLSSLLWQTRMPIIDTENINRKTKILLHLASIGKLLQPLRNFLFPIIRILWRISYYINYLSSGFSLTIVGKKEKSTYEDSLH